MRSPRRTPRAPQGLAAFFLGSSSRFDAAGRLVGDFEIGAMEGGSNLWITPFAQIRAEQEIQARTTLLQRIADGR